MPGTPSSTPSHAYSNIAAHGTAAFAELDSLSAADPQTNKKMGEIARRLVTMRNDLIAARRLGSPCEAELQQINAIISSIFGVEFPSEGLQWQRVCDTREALRRLLDAGFATP